MSFFQADRDIFNCDYDCQDRIKCYVRCVHIYLLSRASYKPDEWNGIKVDVGECIVSEDKIAEKCFITRAKVRKALEHLEKDGYIVTKKITDKVTKRTRVIKVIKYRVSQFSQKKSNQSINQEKDGKVTSINNYKKLQIPMGGKQE